MKFFRIILLTVFSSTIANADGVMKVLNLPYTYLPLLSVEIHTEINNQVAITTSRQTFTNTFDRDVELKYGFPLPLNASATQLRWFKHGLKYQAELVGKPQDTTAVNPGGEIDRQFVDYMGQNPFYFSFRDSLAANSTLILELSYIQLLTYDSGRMLYRYPLNMKSLLMIPLSHFKAAIQLTSEHRLLSLGSLSHPDSVNLADYSGTLYTAVTNHLPDHDFIAEYSTEQDSMGISLLSTKPGDEAGYFLMLVEPNQASIQQPDYERFFLFIIDRSGSMSGSKLQHAKTSVLHYLQNLKLADKFNIFAFNEHVTPFRNSGVTASPANISAATTFVESLTSEGGTAIRNALESGFLQFESGSAANSMLFFSDGQSSLNQSAIQASNQFRVRIFVLGIGSDANRYLLTPLAESNYGFSDYIDEAWNSQKRQAFFDKISQPALTDIQIEFSDGAADSIYPQRFPDIYVGRQLVVLGRYETPGPLTIQLSGDSRISPKNFAFEENFSADSTQNHFVMKMWAKKLIEDLMGQLAAYEESSAKYKAITRRIIDISIKYSIMTPFTSYKDRGATGIRQMDVAATALPEDYVLLQNYPNPFNLNTKLSFKVNQLNSLQTATLYVYNLLGEIVYKIELKINSPGIYSIEWDGSDIFGRKLASGTYVTVLKLGNSILKRKMVLLR